MCLLDDTRKDDKSVSRRGLQVLAGGDRPVRRPQPGADLSERKGGPQQGDRPRRHQGPVTTTLRSSTRQSGAPRRRRPLREGIEFFAQRSAATSARNCPAGGSRPGRHRERAERSPYISQQDYFEIYSRHLEFDRSKALHLSRYLHDLGVFLHFQDDPLLARTVILQNPGPPRRCSGSWMTRR